MTIEAYYSLPFIRECVRGEFNQTSADGFISDADIDRGVNEGYRKYNAILMRADEGFFEETQLLNITANDEEVALPSILGNKKQFLRSTLLERVLEGERIALPYNRRHAGGVSTNNANTGPSYLPSWKFRGSKIVLEPTPIQSVTNGLLLTAQVLPPNLRSTNPQEATGTTITLDLNADPRDDYYNGAQIMITSGNGEGDIRTITDYVGSTKVATVGEAWSTNPNSSSVFSILPHPDWPEDFLMLLYLYATKKAFLKERARGMTIEWDDSVLNDMEKDFKNTYENRATARKFTEPWDMEAY